VQPRSRFRDLDGRTRLVSKTGRSRAAAERALKAELTHRQTPREDRRSGRAGVLTEGREGSSMQLSLGIRASGDGES
jgi:hypothetical protein